LTSSSHPGTRAHRMANAPTCQLIDIAARHSSSIGDALIHVVLQATSCDHSRVRRAPSEGIVNHGGRSRVPRAQMVLSGISTRSAEVVEARMREMRAQRPHKGASTAQGPTRQGCRVAVNLGTGSHHVQSVPARSGHPRELLDAWASLGNRSPTRRQRPMELAARILAAVYARVDTDD